MNSDFKELISTLERHGVRYLIVGAYAVMIYSEPRFTRDLDIFISESADNLARFRTALDEFGFSMSDEQLEALSQFDKMLSIGREPVQIDVFNHIIGLDFEKAYANRNRVEAGGLDANYVALEDLIRAKEAAGRPQDIMDLNGLRSALERNPKN
jgi:predicted nucleotidyltransferase